MNPIYLNGIQVTVTIAPDCCFHELLNYLKGQIDPGSALITSVRINGNEVPNTEEQSIASTPVAHLDLIEVFTSHPKEVADETLYDLVEFSKILENLSITSATQISQVEFQTQFNRLIDGIGTFTEAVSGVKRILKLGLFNSIQALEVNLLNTLRDILKAKEHRQTEYLTQLLSVDLPENLRNWRESGLPSLIRSRDS